MISTLWTVTFTILLAPMSLLALDTSPFDLVPDADGKKICKHSPGSSEPESCYFLLSENPEIFEIEVPETVDLISKVEHSLSIDDDAEIKPEELKKMGGSFVLTRERRERLVNNFSQISVRNIGLDLENSRVEGKNTIVPLIASIRWVGNLGTQGTIYIEADTFFRNDDHPLDLSEELSPDTDLEEANRFFSRALEVTALSDSSTEQRINALRRLETAARNVQIRSIYGLMANVDAKTVSLVEDYIAPYVVADLVFRPLLESFQEALDSIEPH